MSLLDYMSSIRHIVGDFSLEEDHKLKVMFVRTSRALTDEQKAEVVKLSPLRDIRYIAKGSI